MPSSVLALVLFVGFAAPGLCFYLRRELQRPERPLSPLRETASLLLVSVACNASGVAVLGLARWIVPHLTPDLAQLVLTPGKYIANHLWRVWWWSIALLSLACLLGWEIGKFDTREGHKIGRFRWWRGSNGSASIEHVPAWFKYFNVLSHPEPIYCSLILNDGSYVGGYLRWYSTDADETGDRDLVLASPLRVRSPGSEEPLDVDDDLVVVSASRIVYLLATYAAGSASETPTLDP